MTITTTTTTTRPGRRSRRRSRCACRSCATAATFASVHTALDDGQLLRFRHELVDQIGRYRARGVIVDVAALDVIDSFACHTLRNLAQVARLRGAQTVVVGVQPDVALTMARLGTSLHPVATALDLEEGLALLDGPGSAP